MLHCKSSEEKSVWVTHVKQQMVSFYTDSTAEIPQLSVDLLGSAGGSNFMRVVQLVLMTIRVRRERRARSQADPRACQAKGVISSTEAIFCNSNTHAQNSNFIHDDEEDPTFVAF